MILTRILILTGRLVMRILRLQKQILTRYLLPWKFSRNLPDLVLMLNFCRKMLNIRQLTGKIMYREKFTCNFVVETNGTTSNIKVLRSPDQSMSDEATRVVKLMRYTAGVQNGRKVRSYFTLPISFTLGDSDN